MPLRHAARECPVEAVSLEWKRYLVAKFLSFLIDAEEPQTDTVCAQFAFDFYPINVGFVKHNAHGVLRVAWLRFITDPHVLRRGARERHVFAAESGLLAEDAARPALAGQAVADRDAHGFADDLGRELTATAGCETLGHIKFPAERSLAQPNS